MHDTYTRTDGMVTITTTIDSVRHDGIMADRSSYTVAATVTYRGDDWTDTQRHTVSLTGSTHAGHPGPVVLIDGAVAYFVDDPYRFGRDFNADFARNYVLGRTIY